MASTVHPPCVRFGEFVLDPADERLIGPGGPIRIGNKAFQVLWTLVGVQGRLLTKDELFETVWDGTVVSESALTSVIKELRRALGDDSKDPRFIEAVYGRGYRFIAPVSDGDSSDAQSAKLPQAPSPATAAAATKGGWRRSPRTLVAAALGVALVVGVGSWLTLREPASPGTEVTVEPLRASSGDATAQLLSQSLSTDLTRLVVGNDTTFIFADGSDEGVSPANADYVVTGDAQTVSGRVHAALRLVKPTNGAILWSRDFEDASANVASLRQQMALKLGDVLVCAFGSRSGRPRDIDLPTLRLFLSGCENFHSDVPKTREVLGQVIERRPDFAQARGMYAWALFWEANSLGEKKGELLRHEAWAQARRTIALDPGVGGAYYLLALEQMGRANYRRRQEIYRQGTAADPASSQLHQALCTDALVVGFTAEAISDCELAAAHDPFWGGTQAMLARAYAFNGRLDRAWRILDAARVSFPGEPTTSDVRFEVTARVGDAAAALKVIDEPPADLGLPEYPDVWRAFLRARLNPSETEAVSREISAMAPRLSYHGQIEVVQDLVQLDDLDRAFALALTLPPKECECLGYALFRDHMAPMRADPRFREVIKRQLFPIVWAQMDRLPDFCAEPGLKWRCPATPAGWRTFGT